MTNNKIFVPKLNFQILHQRLDSCYAAFQSSTSGFARFNDETQQGRNCPKLVTNSQKRIFQFFCAATLSCQWLRRDILSFTGAASSLSSTHWKFISRNNMSLNCKIGIERVCTVINRLDSSNADVRASQRCVRKNKHGCTWTCGCGSRAMPTGKDHLPNPVIESLTLITGL